MQVLSQLPAALTQHHLYASIFWELDDVKLMAPVPVFSHVLLVRGKCSAQAQRKNGSALRRSLLTTAARSVRRRSQNGAKRP